MKSARKTTARGYPVTVSGYKTAGVLSRVRQGRRRGIFYVKPSTIVDESETEMDKSTKSVGRLPSDRGKPYQLINDCIGRGVLS